MRKSYFIYFPDQPEINRILNRKVGNLPKSLPLIFKSTSIKQTTVEKPKKEPTDKKEPKPKKEPTDKKEPKPKNESVSSETSTSPKNYFKDFIPLQ